MMRHPEYLFIVNPLSGAGKGEMIGKLLSSILPEHPVLKEGAGQVLIANALARDALTELLSKVEVVIAVGGDGTVSHLLPHMLGCAPPPAIGMIPLGTSNDLARALGISVRDDYTDERVLRKTIDRILSAKHEKLDVLCVNEKMFFCNYFSIGLDAAIVGDFDNVRKARWVKLLPSGRLTNNFLYFLMGLKNAGFYLEPPIEILCGERGEEHRIRIDTRIRAIIISNLPFYAGGCHICPDARKDDALFEVTIIRKTYHYLMLIATRFLPFLSIPRAATQYRTQKALIRSSFRSPHQIDGEKGSDLESGERSLTISFHTGLHVLAFR